MSLPARHCSPICAQVNHEYGVVPRDFVLNEKVIPRSMSQYKPSRIAAENNKFEVAIDFSYR